MTDLSFKLEVFEGPLDLMLHLISKHKLNINDIEIAKLLEQYLDYIDKLSDSNMELAGEFLEMAARLIYIKTVSLLPVHNEADELKKELEGRLVEYSLCKQAALILKEQYCGNLVFTREQTKIEIDNTYKLSHNANELLQCYYNISERDRNNMPISAAIFQPIVAKKIVSVTSKIIYILRTLYTEKTVFLDNLYDGLSSKSERVATFLAILELSKSGRVIINDDNTQLSRAFSRSGVTIMQIEDKISIIEAILFASGEPIEIEKIIEASEIEEETVHKLINLLNDKYNDTKSALRILKLNNSYQLATRPEFSNYIKNALETRKSQPLSMAAMEVLTIVAYNQPVTKNFIEHIRGIDSSHIVNTLVEKALLEEAGRLDVPGRPISYKTTDNFLRCFNISSLDELPQLPSHNDQVSFDEVKV